MPVEMAGRAVVQGPVLLYWVTRDSASDPARAGAGLHPSPPTAYVTAPVSECDVPFIHPGPYPRVPLMSPAAPSRPVSVWGKRDSRRPAGCALPGHCSLFSSHTTIQHGIPPGLLI